ncbi:hypothetical protein J4Q44_G00021370 [Coregonus suidteri]|uniref:Uncharacterized protein n=1 Tax=Coregonus suidteri TaxID=861788 RepID=A0AAN8MJA5_9TELE
MAVSAIAHAVADICSKKDCKTAGTVQPWKVLTCTCGWSCRAPGRKDTVFATTVLAECDEGSYVAFGVMLATCCLGARLFRSARLKAARLPQKFNDARFITFSIAPLLEMSG